MNMNILAWQNKNVRLAGYAILEKGQSPTGFAPNAILLLELATLIARELGVCGKWTIEIRIFSQIKKPKLVIMSL